MLKNEATSTAYQSIFWSKLLALQVNAFDLLKGMKFKLLSNSNHLFHNCFFHCFILAQIFEAALDALVFRPHS